MRVNVIVVIAVPHVRLQILPGLGQIGVLVAKSAVVEHKHVNVRGEVVLVHHVVDLRAKLVIP